MKTIMCQKISYLFILFCFSCLSDYEKTVKKIHKQYAGVYSVVSQNFDAEKISLAKIEFVKCENYNYRSASPNYICSDNLITVDGKTLKFGYSYDGELDQTTIFPEFSQEDLASSPNISKTSDIIRGFWRIEISNGILKAEKMQNSRGIPTPFKYTFEAKKQ